ncbi:hypothetical protein P1J78_18315 [Psychromarinibacter sp. C21-152]|uniref:Uncharacterized protein n=1 Tax=Psychromarinibacter sediminicola TaxID=3033385 RepID=A0AAE3NSG3_9RHOB|nr:hypothetical protein [Psychromarinibacter sediminicola]MDF0602698.1 hypothetical protein [Psychromarinibacter sediminicola]
MSTDPKSRESRRSVLKHAVSAAILSATMGSFARTAAAQDRGAMVKLGIRGGGTLLLVNEGKDRWRAVVEADRMKDEKATGLLLLDNGKVVGLRDGYLRLGQFGAADSTFQETVFTQFTETGSRMGKDVLVSQVVLPRQVEDLRNLRAVTITPRVKLNMDQLQLKR